jgi:hypothetical protein
MALFESARIIPGDPRRLLRCEILAGLPRTAPLWRQLSGLVDALAEQTMDKSEIVNHTVYVIINRLEPLDENAGHCRVELRTRFSIVTDLPVEAFEVGLHTSFRRGTIQHARQFFVSHPNLRHGCPLEDVDRRMLIDAACSKPRRAVACGFWHKHFKFELVGCLRPVQQEPRHVAPK